MSVHHRERSGALLPDSTDRPGSAMLLTVEEVAELWFGTVGPGGSASSNCQKIRRLIPETLPARRIGNRWYISRATAEEWIVGADPASAMAHPDSRPDANASLSGIARSAG